MMNKWIIGINEAIREDEIHKIKIIREDKDKEIYEGDLFIGAAYDKKGRLISTLACEIGKDKFYNKLNKILN